MAEPWTVQLPLTYLTEIHPGSRSLISGVGSPEGLGGRLCLLQALLCWKEAGQEMPRIPVGHRAGEVVVVSFFFFS